MFADTIFQHHIKLSLGALPLRKACKTVSLNSRAINEEEQEKMRGQLKHDAYVYGIYMFIRTYIDLYIYTDVCECVCEFFTSYCSVSGGRTSRKNGPPGS